VITLVLGGTRSGKSEVAEQLVAASAAGPVTYIATGQVTDDDMAVRVAAHRARRPASWTTAEAGADLAAALEAAPGPVLVDSLGTWVAAHADLAPDLSALCAALATRHRGGRQGAPATVLVSEEVGLGVHPPTEVGRRFADVLGEVNRAVADVADRVLLVVAGRVLPLARPDGT
jgi:adenosyl cobinamide kinase/adenosyl cobinamide phosphate guanylyltransferase